MLRALFVTTILWIASTAVPAFADPTLGNDLDTCRDRQSDPKLRLDACEKVLAAGQVSGKDLGMALGVRGNALLTRRDNDKAIAAFSASLDADPDNVGIIDARGIAYERKGHPITTSLCRNAPVSAPPTTTAAPSTCAGARCRARSTISMRR